MLKFKLISKENGLYIYEYYPDGDFSKKPGIVSLDINTQEIKILVAAEEDFMCHATAEQLNKSRESINECRKEIGEPPLTEEELPIATEDIGWYYFGDHMLMYLVCRLEDSNFEEEGMVAWY